jgi:hypothetical protein
VPLYPRERVGLPSVVLLTKEGVRRKGVSAIPPFPKQPATLTNPRFMESSN